MLGGAGGRPANELEASPLSARRDFGIFQGRNPGRATNCFEGQELAPTSRRESPPVRAHDRDQQPAKHPAMNEARPDSPSAQSGWGSRGSTGAGSSRGIHRGRRPQTPASDLYTGATSGRTSQQVESAGKRIAKGQMWSIQGEIRVVRSPGGLGPDCRRVWQSLVPDLGCSVRRNQPGPPVVVGDRAGRTRQTLPRWGGDRA